MIFFFSLSPSFRLDDGNVGTVLPHLGGLLAVPPPRKQVMPSVQPSRHRNLVHHRPIPRHRWTSFESRKEAAIRIRRSRKGVGSRRALPSGLGRSGAIAIAVAVHLLIPCTTVRAWLRRQRRAASLEVGLVLARPNVFAARDRVPLPFASCWECPCGKRRVDKRHTRRRWSRRCTAHAVSVATGGRFLRASWAALHTIVLSRRVVALQAVVAVRSAALAFAAHRTARILQRESLLQGRRFLAFARVNNPRRVPNKLQRRLLEALFGDLARHILAKAVAVPTTVVL